MHEQFHLYAFPIEMISLKENEFCVSLCIEHIWSHLNACLVTRFRYYVCRIITGYALEMNRNISTYSSFQWAFLLI